MKVRRNILEKLFLLILYIESIALFQRQFVLGISIVLFGLSLFFEGAKPYWPIFFLIMVLQFFDWSNVQMILILILGLLLSLIKFYQIPIPGKGQFNSGYKALKFQQVDIGIFYPTKQQGKKANWFPNKNYFKTLYEIFYVDPQTKRMPFFIFAFLVSFLTKVQMPVYKDVILHVDKQNSKKKFKVVLFSHGLGANLNVYSCITGWFASHGYIAVSIQHSHDLICVDHRKLNPQDHWGIRDFLYQSRHKDLKIRTNQVRKKKFFQQYLGQTIEVEQIHLSGQSFGACTMIQVMSESIKESLDKHIKSVIALDPWMFPLSKDTYTTIQNKNILVVNSQTFFQSVPYIYELEKKFAEFKKSNPQNLKAFLVTKMNHLDQSDMAFVFGNIMQFFRKDAHFYLSEQLVQLNILFISLFLEGKKVDQIVKSANQFCIEKNLDKVGFEVREQYRFQRDQMLELKRQRQQVVKKLMNNQSWLKRILV